MGLLRAVGDDRRNSRLLGHRAGRRPREFADFAATGNVIGATDLIGDNDNHDSHNHNHNDDNNNNEHATPNGG